MEVQELRKKQTDKKITAAVVLFVRVFFRQLENFS